MGLGLLGLAAGGAGAFNLVVQVDVGRDAPRGLGGGAEQRLQPTNSLIPDSPAIARNVFEWGAAHSSYLSTYYPWPF